MVKSAAHEAAQQLYGDNWQKRRVILMAALLWLAGCITYLIFKGTDTALAAQVSLGMLAAFTSLIGFYLFGSVWDDSNKRTLLPTHPGFNLPEYDALAAQSPYSPIHHSSSPEDAYR